MCWYGNWWNSFDICGEHQRKRDKCQLTCAWPSLRARLLVQLHHVVPKGESGTGAWRLSGTEKGSSWTKFTCHFQCESEIAFTPASRLQEQGTKIRGNRRTECAVAIQTPECGLDGGPGWKREIVAFFETCCAGSGRSTLMTKQQLCHSDLFLKRQKHKPEKWFKKSELRLAVRLWQEHHSHVSVKLFCHFRFNKRQDECVCRLGFSVFYCKVLLHQLRDKSWYIGALAL